MSLFKRRDVIKTGALAAAGLSFGCPAIGRSRSINEELRVAVIGTGGRGGAHISGFQNAKNSRLVALCDADEKVVYKRAGEVKKKYDLSVDHYTDYRQVLDRKDVDAITIATPNHWHALMTIYACQAEKHVYVEKPVCHTIWEGRKMVEAMQKYKRVVQAGFQNRSVKALLDAMPRIHSGELGEIKSARGLCYRNRGSIGKRDTPLTPPPEVDYNLWLGPAAELPIYRKKFHYDWHWDFNTGNGDMGNQGPHEMDLLRWALGNPVHPVTVQSFGGRFAWNDGGNTPNLQFAMFDFGNGVPVFFEVRNIHQKDKNDKNIEKIGMYSKGPGVGIVVTGDKAEFRGGRGGGAFYDLDGNVIQKFGGGDSGHMQNFVDAVRIGDPETLRSPIESAYYSSCMSHLANISVLSGQPMGDSEVSKAISGNKDATECFDRFSEQLAYWKVDTKDTPWNMGPKLTFDPKAEKFTQGDNLKKANDLVKREDRKPFVVPAEV